MYVCGPKYALFWMQFCACVLWRSQQLTTTLNTTRITSKGCTVVSNTTPTTPTLLAHITQGALGFVSDVEDYGGVGPGELNVDPGDPGIGLMLGNATTGNSLIAERCQWRCNKIKL